MNLSKITTGILLAIHLSTFAQQRQTFDLASFIPPQGWQNEEKDFATSYVTTNNISGGWCRITLYKSLTSSGDAVTDFRNEWKNIIARDFPDVVEPTLHTDEEDGWKANTGASNFQFNGQPAAASLTTVSGYGVKLSICVLTNTDEFEAAINAFSESVQMQKPVIKQQPSNNTPQQTNTSITTAGAATPKSGIAMPRTNFNDGWVAQAFSDYVRVTKGNIAVLLHYDIQLNDELRKGNAEANLFDRLILPRYTVHSVQQQEKEQFCYFCVYFFEADVTDKNTGVRSYLGFRVITENGTSRCIEILATSRDEFKAAFATPEKVADMLGYNKFAITLADLAGKWQGGSGAAMNMYYTGTGNYAGMNAVAMADSFVFNRDGSYTSHHSGASGMVGNMSTYDQKYAGKVTVTNWGLVATNRWKGATEEYDASFESIPGGWMLHLRNKQSTGLRYDLVKGK
jgi:hypothetical protein